MREVKEELNLDVHGEPTLIGVYAFERMNQVIIGYHVAATGTIALNEELDDYKHVPFDQCRKSGPLAPALHCATGCAAKGIEPEMMELPDEVKRVAR